MGRFHGASHFDRSKIGGNTRSYESEEIEGVGKNERFKRDPSPSNCARIDSDHPFEHTAYSLLLVPLLLLEIL